VGVPRESGAAHLGPAAFAVRDGSSERLYGCKGVSRALGNDLKRLPAARRMDRGAHRHEAATVARSALGLTVMRLELQILDQEERTGEAMLWENGLGRRLTRGLTAAVMCSVFWLRGEGKG
jgi:hypothetical protein